MMEMLYGITLTLIILAIVVWLIAQDFWLKLLKRWKGKKAQLSKKNIYIAGSLIAVIVSAGGAYYVITAQSGGEYACPGGVNFGPTGYSEIINNANISFFHCGNEIIGCKNVINASACESTVTFRLPKGKEWVYSNQVEIGFTDCRGISSCAFDIPIKNKLTGDIIGNLTLNFDKPANITISRKVAVQQAQTGMVGINISTKDCSYTDNSTGDKINMTCDTKSPIFGSVMALSYAEKELMEVSSTPTSKTYAVNMPPGESILKAVASWQARQDVKYNVTFCTAVGCTGIDPTFRSNTTYVTHLNITYQTTNANNSLNLIDVPVTVNLTSLGVNGSRSSLLVVYNNASTVSFDWLIDENQRKAINDTIVFRVNVSNGTYNSNWTIETQNLSYDPVYNNVTLFTFIMREFGNVSTCTANLIKQGTNVWKGNQSGGVNTGAFGGCTANSRPAMTGTDYLVVNQRSTNSDFYQLRIQGNVDTNIWALYASGSNLRFIRGVGGASDDIIFSSFSAGRQATLKTMTNTSTSIIWLNNTLLPGNWSSGGIGNFTNIGTIPNAPSAFYDESWIGNLNVDFNLYQTDPTINFLYEEIISGGAADTTGPSVRGVTCAPSSNATGTRIGCSATITDDTAVSVATANVTHPNGTTYNISALLISGSNYSLYYNNTIASGNYSVWFWANDTSNNVGSNYSNFSIWCGTNCTLAMSLSMGIQRLRLTTPNVTSPYNGTSKNVEPQNQTAVKGVFNISNNASIAFNAIQLSVNSSVGLNITVCALDNYSVGSCRTVTQAWNNVTINGSLAVGVDRVIWLWINLTNATVGWRPTFDARGIV